MVTLYFMSCHSHVLYSVMLCYTWSLQFTIASYDYVACHLQCHVNSSTYNNLQKTYLTSMHDMNCIYLIHSLWYMHCCVITTHLTNTVRNILVTLYLRVSTCHMWRCMRRKHYMTRIMNINDILFDVHCCN